MTRILRHALLPAVVAVLSLSAPACKCKDGVCETTQGYVGTPVEQKVPWAAGLGVKVNVAGGNVRVGSQAETSITVSQGSDTSNIVFRFTPINNETSDNEEKAKKEMGAPAAGGNLVLSSSSANGFAEASVSQTGTHSSGLSATVDVLVPPGFDGDVIAQTAYGSIYVGKASKSVTATTTHGAVEVALEAPPPPEKGGKLATDFGDVIFTYPASGTQGIQAQATGNVTANIPSTWTEVAGSTANAKTLQPLAGTSGSAGWSLSTANGVIQITVR